MRLYSWWSCTFCNAHSSLIKHYSSVHAFSKMSYPQYIPYQANWDLLHYIIPIQLLTTYKHSHYPEFYNITPNLTQTTTHQTMTDAKYYLTIHPSKTVAMKFQNHSSALWPCCVSNAIWFQHAWLQRLIDDAGMITTHSGRESIQSRNALRKRLIGN